MKEKSVLFWKKIPLKRILLFLFLLYLAALIVPYIPHKKVSDSFRKSFSENTFYSNSTGTERAAYIDDNEEALAYRLRMIEEAQEEIILSTFDFNAEIFVQKRAVGEGLDSVVALDGLHRASVCRNKIGVAAFKLDKSLRCFGYEADREGIDRTMLSPVIFEKLQRYSVA